MIPRRSARSFGGIGVRTPPAPTHSRIGLLGGSFNPAHPGHRHVSAKALQRLSLDSVWWIVTPGNPLKSRNGLAGVSARVVEARRVAASPRIRVTAFEAALGSTYTADTLAFLRRRYPAARFVWLMGADNLAGFHRWRNWQHIFADVAIAVLDRPGWRMKALASPAAHRFRRAFVPDARAAEIAAMRPPAWTFVTLPLTPVSSTAIRARRAGKG